MTDFVRVELRSVKGAETVYARKLVLAGGRDGSGALLFGKLEATSLSAVLKASWTFTPRLSLQIYAQLLVAAKHFSDFSRSGAPT